MDMFDEARRRVHYALPLPRRQIAAISQDKPAKTFLEEALRTLTEGSVVRINDRIANLRALTRHAFLQDASHRQCEEAVRVIGASLGLSSSRPCNDFGIGPDNLWIDLQNKKMLAFELKTEKKQSATLSKDDIGQGLNHLEWLKKQYFDLHLLGLIFLTDCRKVSEKGSPSDQMYLGSQQGLRSLWEEFLNIIERIRPRTPIERLIEAEKTGELTEWSSSGIFRRLAEARM
jgi:hypothetical protein